MALKVKEKQNEKMSAQLEALKEKILVMMPNGAEGFEGLLGPVSEPDVSSITGKSEFMK